METVLLLIVSSTAGFFLKNIYLVPSLQNVFKHLFSYLFKALSKQMLKAILGIVYKLWRSLLGNVVDARVVYALLKDRSAGG